MLLVFNSGSKKGKFFVDVNSIESRVIVDVLV